MPNRILREGILSSDRVDQLSDGAELFYRRLISVVDDYGRYYASPGTLRGACWPLRPERVTDEAVIEWLIQCSRVGLVQLYLSGRSRFLQVVDFKQQVRAKSKFPDPDNNCTADAEQMLITSRSRISESKTESEAHTQSEPECDRVREMPRKRTAADESGQTSQLWDEFWEKYPLKQRKDFACMEWSSYVTTANENAVLGCLDRYLLSDQVQRGVVMNPDKWLREQHRAKWKGDWPRAPDKSAAIRKPSVADVFDEPIEERSHI